ncbi:reticulon-4 receptor-like 2 isoform X2 [Dermacentor albipictus]|uniref:reticulon-4 receptor-like 2 isoform X2 n=1 Tax=Dermacentor albipictus TaxID=60249 RepID=UPI0031FC373D
MKTTSERLPPSTSRTLLAADQYHLRLVRRGRRLAAYVLRRCHLLVTALTVCVLVMAPAVEGSCPSREFIYPCTCTETFIGNYVMCTVVRDDQLRLPFQYLRDYNLSRLFLSNVTSSLNPDVFTGLKVGTFKVADSRFKMEDTRQMGGWPSVSTERWTRIQNLEFMRCYVDAGANFFGALDQLETLSLLNSTVTRFGREWIGALVNLTHLMVDAVSFHKLDDDALADLPNLSTLVWSGNGAVVLKRQFFPLRARRLKSIDLSDNELTSLPSDMFQNMPVLESVTLSRNHFQTLSPEPWKPMLGQLRLVTLDGNPIDCNGTISWMLQSNARHKVSGTCAAPPNLAGTRISDLDDSRLRR